MFYIPELITRTTFIDWLRGKDTQPVILGKKQFHHNKASYIKKLSANWPISFIENLETCDMQTNQHF